MSRVTWLLRFVFLGFHLNDWNVQWIFHPLFGQNCISLLWVTSRISIPPMAPQYMSSVTPLTSTYASSFSAKDLTGPLYRFLELLLSITLLSFMHLSSPHLQCLPPQLRDMLGSIWAPHPPCWHLISACGLRAAVIVGFISSLLSSQDFSPTLPIVQLFKTIASHILSIVIVV